jgi:serine/threonine protein phosphatase PrpC
VKFNEVLLTASEVFPPLSALVHADFAARSRRGPGRDNTDHYLVIRLQRSQETLLTSLPAVGKRFDEQAYGCVIADGMGETGEKASRLTISALLELALRYCHWQVRVDERVATEVMESLTEFYRQIDCALVAANRTTADTPLLTTLTALVSAGKDLFFAHVGHSRAYLYRGDQLIQLTRDHTQAAQRTRPAASLVDPTEAVLDLHHMVTEALGSSSIDRRIDVERVTLVNRDVVMLCTNGLTDVVGDEEIARVLGSDRTPDEKTATLIDAAIRSHANDDVTVVIGHYDIPE